MSHLLMNKRKYGVHRRRGNTSCFYCGTKEKLTVEHVLPKSLFKHCPPHVSKSRLMALACDTCNQMHGNFFSSYDNCYMHMLKPTNVELHVKACEQLINKIRGFLGDSFYAKILCDEISEMISVFLDPHPLTFDKSAIYLSREEG
jgi:hypothetical protein